MRKFIQSLLQHESYRRALERWAAITAPIRQALAPLVNRWLSLTAPLRTRWAAFRQRNPRSGWVLAWAGTLFKWGFCLLLFLVFGVWIGLFGDLPGREELRNIETANATEVYTADSVLIGKYYIENRTAISLDKISPYVITALLATEDKRFFEHSGIDLQSWFRVGYGLLAGRESLGGGSTLSQQLAKNLYPRKRYYIPGISLIINKIRENFISTRLEGIYNKAELLNLYLNTVPFGGDRFGINVASKHFFNKKSKDLTADQAATLIGMLKASTAFDPVRNPTNAQRRRNVVLQQMVKNSEFSFETKDKDLLQVQEMVKNGRVTQKDYDELSKKPVGAKRYGGDSNNDGSGTYFREYLRTEIMPDILEKFKKDDGASYNLYRDGLKIYTTLNSKMQQYAEEAVQKHMQTLQGQFDKHWKGYKEKPWGDDKWIDQQLRNSERWDACKEAGMSDQQALESFEKPARMTIFSWKNGGSESDTTMSPIDSVRYYFCLLNCGFLAMEHHTGYIRAWVGGTHFKYFKYDHILSRRQVGSTFKPIVYAAAIQDSIMPCTYFPNELVKIKDWEPHNSDETYGGWCSVLGGITYSVNVVAAQIIEKVGIEKTIQLAKKMGITSTLPREFGISLGAADISLYEMIKVYGTLGNEGKRPEPVAVMRVTTRMGEVIYDYKQELQKDPKLGPHETALSVDQAATMTRMLKSVIDYGTGSRFRRGFGLFGDFAGKTGTTQNQSDGWFICYNPRLVTGAWVGAKSPAVRFRSMDLGQGSAMALPIVAWFWHKVANDRKLTPIFMEKFPEPKPEVLARFGCPFKIAVSPDTLDLLMQDSTIRDSLRANGFKNLKEVSEVYFGAGADDGDAVEDPEADKALTEEEREKRRQERRQKRRDFFDKLFNRTREEEKEKKKDNQQ